MGSDPAIIWECLKKRFEPAVVQRKFDLKDKLNTLQMPEGTSVEQFLLNIDTLVC